jgi:hypothetical protein
VIDLDKENWKEVALETGKLRAVFSPKDDLQSLSSAT